MNIYDPNNIFAKIIRKEMPAKIVFEDDNTLAFYDAYPVAPKHILVVPKGQYLDYNDFMNKASDKEVKSFFSVIKQITEKLQLDSFRLITNLGRKSGQSVFHFHVHIISGKELKGLIQDE